MPPAALSRGMSEAGKAVATAWEVFVEVVCQLLSTRLRVT